MVDLINQIDFKREIVNQNQTVLLPQNIQAIKVLITQSEIILEPNSKSLPIDTRLIVNRKDFRISVEDLKSRKLQESAQLYSAFLGFINIKQVIFLLMVDRCSHHQLHPLYKDFFHIHSTKFIALDNRAASVTEIQEAVSNLKNLLSKGFYFTYEKCDDIDREEFMWNRGLCKQLYTQQIKNWDVLMIQGFMDSFSVYLEGKRVQVALIAKRSLKAPGTRLTQTGVQKDGSVANFVETTQIVVVANLKCQFKQIRGSVPVFWRESGNLLMKKLELYGTEQENQIAFINHFNRLVQNYERVLAVNLMNKNKQQEHDLIQAYELGIHQYQPDRLKYIYYNFDEITQGVDFHIINQDIMKIGNFIKNMQFDAYDLVTNQRKLKQRGIVRTNCLACLDRTNVYQQRVGLLMLEYQLKCMGLDLERILGYKVLEINENNTKFLNPIILLFKQMWGDHGDYISYHYTGTGSLHTNQDRGQQSFLAILGSGMVPLSRFYRNNFSEHLRQESILTLLGNSTQDKIYIDNDQSYLPFTTLVANDLSKIGYANLHYISYKLSEDQSKYTIYAMNEDQNIQIQCFIESGKKYNEVIKIHNELDSKFRTGLKIKNIDNKRCLIVELGTINLYQLAQNELVAFSEYHLVQILLDMAQQIKLYKSLGLYLNGLTAKSVWFQFINQNQYKLYFDIITYIPTVFAQYPTTIKPDYMDPIIIQKIDQQEQALERQENIENTNDLITQHINTFTEEQVEQAQIWILARIIYVILYYPQPSQTNNIDIMLPNLNQMIELKKFASLAQLLKRMFRQDLLSPILDIDQLIQEAQNIKKLLGNQSSLIIPDKPFKQTQFQEKQLKSLVDLCKHFRCYEQGLQIIVQLQKLLQDAQLEDKVQLVSDHLFFLIYLGNIEEAFETMLEFQELLDQCNQAEIPDLKQIIIDTNLLFLRLFQEFQQLNFTSSQLKEILLEDPPQNFTHPLRSILYLIWSEITIEEDIQLNYALKALEYYSSSKVQHEYLKIQIHIQIIKGYIKKLQTQKAQEHIQKALTIIIGDTLEKCKLYIELAKIMLELQEVKQAKELYEKAIKSGIKVYKNDKHPVLLEWQSILAQIKQ
ncbi:unnamed protein product (macronuclear) [Paramecium tetraurelia]|uniref:SAC domain-containing protein n=1 Tax=Paramecium tetraurelia TaxID=5888 RepID=A0CUE4_PARTE|nr:uncharacterized protein GSPATT00010611001 [Paramecium tetraurelia]CAK74411.1 unnamed protein product [Paramecium tetraurelia]|eukprot:XP_001441808.1 hypothetical protein (macronuclear) [Paramecium tetraurelia strain d4-2]